MRMLAVDERRPGAVCLSSKSANDWVVDGATPKVRSDQGCGAHGGRDARVVRLRDRFAPQARGGVVAQYPAAGSHAPASQAISLIVTDTCPRAIVPNVVGQEYQEYQDAKAALNAAGFTVINLHAVTAGCALSVIGTQSPAAGTSLPKDQGVDLAFASTPCPP